MTEDLQASEKPETKVGWFRRLYDWVLHWAYTPYAQPALFILAFAESSFFPIPPDTLLLPMCLGNRLKGFRFAAVCSVASILGGLFGYWLGAEFWDLWVRDFCFAYLFSEDTFGKIQSLYAEYDFWIVFTAGFSPLPYKVFTVSAGVFDIDLMMFLLASAISRSGRFFLEAILLRIWGAQIKEFIEKRLGLVSLVFCVLLIGGFFLIKVVLPSG